MTLIGLRIKAKLRKFKEGLIFQKITSADITPVFLFMAIHLFGYEWNWKTLLGCVGLWIVVKELYKFAKDVADKKKIVINNR